MYEVMLQGKVSLKSKAFKVPDVGMVSAYAYKAWEPYKRGGKATNLCEQLLVIGLIMTQLSVYTCGVYPAVCIDQKPSSPCAHYKHGN